MFYKIFEELCDEKGVTPHKACLDMGLGRSTAANWKCTGNTPRAETMQKIADYFQVPVSYLTSGGDKNKLATDYDDELKNIIELIRDRSDLRALFYEADSLTPAQLKTMISFVQSIKGTNNAD